MKSEELAAQWCRDHPDATLEQAFMAGLGHKMNMNKDSLSERKDKFRSEVLMLSLIHISEPTRPY